MICLPSWMRIRTKNPAIIFHRRQVQLFCPTVMRRIRRIISIIIPNSSSNSSRLIHMATQRVIHGSPVPLPPSHLQIPNNSAHSIPTPSGPTNMVPRLIRPCPVRIFPANQPRIRTIALCHFTGPIAKLARLGEKRNLLEVGPCP